MLYRHDGSLDGMLAAIGRALARRRDASVGPATGSELPFGEPILAADHSGAEAEALLARVEQELGRDWVRRVLRVLCSEEAGADATAHRVLGLAFAHGPAVAGYHAQTDVRRALAIERRVGAETHRLKGLLRFRRLAGGRLWGPVEPRHNVLALMAPHFRRRLDPEPWLLHDAARGFGIGGGPGPPQPWSAAEIARELSAGLDSEEHGFQELWRTYYDAIAIRARTNPRAQRRNMPARYWRWLVEKPGHARSPGKSGKATDPPQS